MNYRFDDLLAEKSFAADTTEPIDINVADPISQIMIELDVLGVGGVATAHAIACLKKIELVDGSDVLFSLTGFEAEALDFYHHGHLRSNWNPYLTTLYCQRFLAINFGRFLWDPEMAFDPKHFKNPQLRLTLDIDAGGNASTTNKLHVWAAMFDQKIITPAGFLMAKEIKDYTMTASAHEYTDLPTDYRYRALYIKNLEAGTEPNVNIANIKLAEDQNKRVLFNCPPNDILRQNPLRNPQIIEQIMFSGTAEGKNVFTTATERCTATFAKWAASVGTLPHASLGSAGGRMVVYSGSSENAVAIVAGYIPHGVFEVPFWSRDLIEEYYDVAKVGSLKLDVTTGSGAAGTEKCQIFTEQYRPYGA